MSRERMDKICAWGRRCSVTGLVLLLGGTALFRLEFMEFRLPFLSVVLGALLALMGLILSLIILPHQGDRSFKKKIRVNILISVLTLFFPITALVSGMNAPSIHDITTDTQNPPVFKAVVKIRPANANTLDIKPDDMEIQKQAYPDMKPLYIEIPKPILFAQALVLVENRGWELVAKNSQRGEIEAVATTPSFGFKDDVIIRITKDDNRYRVDMRSVSRAGKGDLGANAKRIKAFLEELKLALQ